MIPIFLCMSHIMLRRIYALLYAVQPSSKILARLGWTDDRFHLATSHRICNRRGSPRFMLFLRWNLVFINHIWILINNCLSSIIALLHLILFLLRIIHCHMVVVVWSWEGATADRVLCASHIALSLSLKVLIILSLMLLHAILTHFHFCYCVMLFLIIF